MRLPNYDYSQPGYYFVTICTRNRAELFGYSQDGRIQLNDYGKIVRKCWLDLPNHYVCELDDYVIMPNHFHGIISIPDWTKEPSSAAAGLNPQLRGGSTKTPRHHPLTEIVRGLKTFSAAGINNIRLTPGASVWQRSFHERVLRGEDDLLRIREYIQLNPERWSQDSNNPVNF